MVCVVAVMLFVLIYQSITALIIGEGLIWENYLGLSVTPVDVILVVGTGGVCGIVWLWHRYVKRELGEDTKSKKHKRNGQTDSYWSGPKLPF